MFPVFTVARHRAEVEAANAVDAVAAHGMHVGDTNLNNSAQDLLIGVVPLDDYTSQQCVCGDGTSPVMCVGIRCIFSDHFWMKSRDMYEFNKNLTRSHPSNNTTGSGQGPVAYQRARI